MSVSVVENLVEDCLCRFCHIRTLLRGFEILHDRNTNVFFLLGTSVVEPEPKGARTFGQSRYTEVSAPAPGQTKLVY